MCKGLRDFTLVPRLKIFSAISCRQLDRSMSKQVRTLADILLY